MRSSRVLARPALLVAALLVWPATASADPGPDGDRFVFSPNQRWFVAVHPDSSFEFGERRYAAQTRSLLDVVISRGQLPAAPEELAVFDDGQGFVAIDSFENRGHGDIVTLVDSDGVSWARHGMDALFDPSTHEAFWAPDRSSVAWRVDWWVDPIDDLVVLIPDRPGQPIAVSLSDGLVENPDPRVYVRRMSSASLWFGSRLRALELATAAAPGPDGLFQALRGIVREQDAPLVLRLRAAAVLRQYGDPTGRSLVLLTARAAEGSRFEALASDELRRLPEPDRPCDEIPPPAIDRPYDHRAARSYAIQLLPSFLRADAAPWLGELLASDDDQDRFDSLQAIACLAQQQPGTTDALFQRVRQRHERETERLGSISRIVPLGSAEIPAELRSDALSLDLARHSDAVDSLLARSPASNPLLLALLEEGSSDDARIAGHFVANPDPRAVGPLLVALKRYAEVPETGDVLIAALAACVSPQDARMAPTAVGEVGEWLEWGRTWRTARNLEVAAQLAMALLPLLILIGMGRRKG